jgi:hypothetical protein
VADDVLELGEVSSEFGMKRQDEFEILTLRSSHDAADVERGAVLEEFGEHDASKRMRSSVAVKSGLHNLPLTGVRRRERCRPRQASGTRAYFTCGEIFLEGPRANAAAVAAQRLRSVATLA